MDIQHRGGMTTAEMYKGIPVHASVGVHEAAVDLLRSRVGAGARVADLGAGNGALSQRLHDAGFAVTAIDVSDNGWMATDVGVTVCDLDGGWLDVREQGPFDAILSIEVIEHLENPREFLRKIVKLAAGRETVLIVSTPNPIDTFSCITMFRRGTFNWFSPAHYSSGGHISILPFWLIDKHLQFLAQPPCTWSFHAAFRHPSAIQRAVYSAIARLRRLASKGAEKNHFDGETALGVVSLNG